MIIFLVSPGTRHCTRGTIISMGEIVGGGGSSLFFYFLLLFVSCFINIINHYYSSPCVLFEAMSRRRIVK